MKAEAYNVVKDDMVVAGWNGEGTNPVDGVFTGAIVGSVLLTKERASRQFFVSEGLAQDIADYVGGEVIVYRERGNLKSI